MADRITEMIAAATAKAKRLALSQGKGDLVARFERTAELAEMFIVNQNDPEMSDLYVRALDGLSKQEAMDLIMLLSNEVGMRRKAQENFDARGI